MNIWYRVYGHSIEPVRVVKENAATVVVARKRFSLEADAPEEWMERRHSKISQWDCYFPTLQEAIDHMRKEAEDQVAAAEAELQRATERRERVRAYTEQAVAAAASSKEAE